MSILLVRINPEEGVSMAINKISGSSQAQRYADQSAKDAAKQEVAKGKTANGKDKIEISSEALAAQANQKTEQEKPLSRTESIVKMTETERAELVSKLKEEQQKSMEKMFDFVRETLSSQGAVFGKTDDMWKFIASGEYKVDELTQLEAQEAISEDGYRGVKQTSERIFDFAVALTGGDEAKMREMEEAVSKGFEEAEKAWGGALPSITTDTHHAVKQKFEDYYASLRPQVNESYHS